ncbi:MAG TPA: hypothetical protein VGC77_03840 [Rhodopseudomonas sp.]|uniref:hypothetical protein n=1 Tax=Rhodopseudomonas sp. TaxID=1078 RepID=UPI002EDAA397
MSAEQGDSVEASHGAIAGGASPAGATPATSSAATEPVKAAPPAAAAGPAPSAASDQPHSDPVHVEGAPNLVPEHSGPTQPAKDAAAAAASPRAGQITIMSPLRDWDDRIGGEQRSSAEAPRGLFGKRRATAMAAVIAVAAIAGALGGALATASLGHPVADTSAVTRQTQALNEQIARLDADLAALKGNVDHSAKQTAAQIAQLGKAGDKPDKTGDRFDKVEKAQADAATKLAKLSDAVDKLKAPTPVAAAPAATPVAAKDATGSLAASNANAAATTSAAAQPPKPELARLPTVPGWVLHDVANGAAVIEGRQGMFEVYAGDPIPGLGRVDAIRRQDGRWVVVTSRGLIVAR